MSIRSWILILSLSGIIILVWVYFIAISASLITLKRIPTILFGLIIVIGLTLIFSVLAGCFAEVRDNANVLGIPIGLASSCALSYFYYYVALLEKVTIGLALSNGISAMIFFGVPIILLCRYLGVKGYELGCQLRHEYIKAAYEQGILSGDEVSLQRLFNYELKLQNAFLKRGMKWTPIIDDVNRNIALTYLIAINDSIFLSDFAKRFKITEQQARNILSYSIKSKLIDGYLTRDGKEFITSRRLLELLRSKIE